MEAYERDLKAVVEEHERIVQKITDKYLVAKYEKELAKERAKDFEKSLYDQSLYYLEKVYQKRLAVREKWFAKEKEVLRKRAMKVLSKDIDSFLEKLKMNSR